MKKPIVILHTLLDKIKCDRYYLSLILDCRKKHFILTDYGDIHYHFSNYYDEYKPFQIKKIKSICKKYGCEYDFANKELIKKVNDKDSVKKYLKCIEQFLRCQSKIYQFIFDDKTEKRYYKN